MQVLSGSVATLAVAAIYCVWRAYFQLQLRQQRTLYERVAYMIWTLANQAN
jgi:hypothetical protein